MKVFIVTGEINHGKTRYLRELYELLIEKNIKTGGFTSNGIINKEGLKDFEICNLSDNKSMHLASRNQYPGYIKMNESFYFNPAAIEFGNNILEDTLKNNSSVVIIDEIGPIELNGRVWY
ncbi:MAG: nucleoside-triphosphatase, partial [Bacteroidales bacterium]